MKDSLNTYDPTYILQLPATSLEINYAPTMTSSKNKVNETEYIWHAQRMAIEWNSWIKLYSKARIRLVSCIKIWVDSDSCCWLCDYGHWSM